MTIKELYLYARNNDFKTFEAIMTDEIGPGGVLKLDGLLNKSSNIQETAKELIKLACAHFEIEEELLASKNRKRELVYIRTALTIVLRDMFPNVERYYFALVFCRGHSYLNWCESRHENDLRYKDYKTIYERIKKL